MAMKVGGPSGPSRIQTSKTEKAKKAGKPGEFASHLRHVDASTGEEITAADQVSAVAGLGGILAAQAADPETGQPDYQERKRRARRGEDILERLDEIRKGLLLGTVPKDRLATLARLVREKREKGADPLISQLLDEIELRAEVELAKLSRR
ncbi:MAG: flagellar assembly protein FliX [Alphaproteobacteria bacterium]|nr:flagellar assembly protein FliX [Alphaproteobacteria bacterium]